MIKLLTDCLYLVLSDGSLILVDKLHKNRFDKLRDYHPGYDCGIAEKGLLQDLSGFKARLKGGVVQVSRGDLLEGNWLSVGTTEKVQFGEVLEIHGILPGGEFPVTIELGIDTDQGSPCIITADCPSYPEALRHCIKSINYSSVSSPTKKWIPGHQYDSGDAAYWYLGDSPEGLHLIVSTGVIPGETIGETLMRIKDVRKVHQVSQISHGSIPILWMVSVRSSLIDSGPSLLIDTDKIDCWDHWLEELEKDLTVMSYEDIAIRAGSVATLMKLWPGTGDLGRLEGVLAQALTETYLLSKTSEAIEKEELDFILESPDTFRSIGIDFDRVFDLAKKRFSAGINYDFMIKYSKVLNSYTCDHTLGITLEKGSRPLEEQVGSPRIAKALKGILGKISRLMGAASPEYVRNLSCYSYNGELIMHAEVTFEHLVNYGVDQETLTDMINKKIIVYICLFCKNETGRN